VDPATLQHLLDQVPTAALALIGLYLFTAGRLHSDREMQQTVRRAEGERDRALTDLQTERAAHEKTREALAAANVRADAGVRAAELLVAAVEGGRRVPKARP